MREELKEYICYLDDVDKTMIESRAAEKGVEEYLSQQLVYLDCSRVINGMRMMQTIGYPYSRDITAYLHILDKAESLGLANKDEWVEKLINLHKANLKYEEEHPPVWYGGKKAKDSWIKSKAGKTPRRRNVDNQSTPKSKELTASERLKKLSAEFGNLTFKLKPHKKDE